MKKILKWLAIVLGALVALVLLAAVGLLIYGQMRFKPTHANRPLAAITADTSPEGLARGKYLMEGVMSCDKACHSPEGRPFTGTVENINESPIQGVFAVPNLTPDQETGLGSWTDAEIARAIREGVDKDGVELVVMPSYSYHVLSDADVAAIVGYLRSLEPVRNPIPPISVNAVGKVMGALGLMGPRSLQAPITSSQISPKPGTVENGEYLVGLGECRGCHQPNLAGGTIPFAAPGTPPSANLTPAGELVSWTATDFTRAVREGIAKSGRTLHEEMPRYQMTEADLADIFSYLQTLPPAESKY